MSSLLKQHQLLLANKDTNAITYTDRLSPIFTKPASDLPSVFVIYSIAHSTTGIDVHLSFAIQKTSWLNFAKFSPQNLLFKDFLWQDNCLECFVEFDQQTSYHEINFAPNGNYAIYQFDDYRTPNHMPPKHGNGILSASDYMTNSRHAHYWLRHYSVKFLHQQSISKINPTAILYWDHAPIFYAIWHANPPDFHNKKYWRHLT